MLLRSIGQSEGLKTQGITQKRTWNDKQNSNNPLKTIKIIAIRQDNG